VVDATPGRKAKRRYAHVQGARLAGNSQPGLFAEEQNMTLTTETWRDRIVPETDNEALACPDCGKMWILTRRQKDWFLAKALVPPRRCEACRAARRLERTQ
jgi:predicted RNA-binding Zn-ribbon protein involved in translation (DUF1610 family)